MITDGNAAIKSGRAIADPASALSKGLTLEIIG